MAEASEEALRLVEITKQFPGVLALDEVSLDLKRGEVHVLVGDPAPRITARCSSPAGRWRSYIPAMPRSWGCPPCTRSSP